MKKVFLKSIALMMVLTLLGCQGATNTVDTELEQTQATVAQSIVETETLESESTINIPVSTKTIAEMVQAPEKMVYEFENPEVSNEVVIDAEIVIPDADGMDVVPFYLDDVSEKEIEILYNNLFSEGAVYAEPELVKKLIDVSEMCKERIHEQFETNLNDYEADSDEPRIQRVRENIKKSYEFSIWTYETILLYLNNMLTQTTPDFSVQIYENPFGENVECGILLAANGEFFEMMFVVNDTVQFSKYHISQVDRILKGTTRGTMYKWEDMFYRYAQSEFEMSTVPPGKFGMWPESMYEEWFVGEFNGEQTADNLKHILNECDYTDFGTTVISHEGAVDINKSLQEGVADWLIKKGFMIELGTTYKSLNVVGDHLDRNLQEGTVYSQWFDDGWWEVNMTRPLKLEQPLQQKVELLPFDRISEIATKRIEEGLSVEEEYNWLCVKCVESIRLEYAFIGAEGENDGIVVPAWNFYCVQERTIEGEYAYTQYELVASINAIDGSFIY